MTNQIVKQTSMGQRKPALPSNPVPSNVNVPGPGTVVLSPQPGLQPCHSTQRGRQQNPRIPRQPALAVGWSTQKRWQCRSIP
jgi:hypothetical protein